MENRLDAMGCLPHDARRLGVAATRHGMCNGLKMRTRLLMNRPCHPCNLLLHMRQKMAFGGTRSRCGILRLGSSAPGDARAGWKIKGGSQCERSRMQAQPPRRNVALALFKSGPMAGYPPVRCLAHRGGSGSAWDCIGWRSSFWFRSSVAIDRVRGSRIRPAGTGRKRPGAASGRRQLDPARRCRALPRLTK